MQLRAIAELPSGTSAQFNVYWDGEHAVIETGKPYTGTATPAALKNTDNVRKSKTSFKLDGTIVTFDNAYLIDGDTNYLQLREFASKLNGTASQFNVYWDDAAGLAVIVPGEKYTGLSGNESGFTNIKLGQTEAQADIGKYLFSSCETQDGIWKFYGSYAKFLAVYYVNNKAAYLYTNDFSTYTTGGKIYKDSKNNNLQYAVSVGTFPDCDDTTTERLIFEFTNAFRGVYGLPALKWNDRLANAARFHSLDIAKRDFFDHVNPYGKNPGDRISAAGYDWRAYAENILMASWGIEADFAVDCWINSAGHLKNMLTTTCNELGVGVSGKYATQNFGKKF